MTQQQALTMLGSVDEVVCVDDTCLLPGADAALAGAEPGPQVDDQAGASESGT